MLDKTASYKFNVHSRSSFKCSTLYYNNLLYRDIGVDVLRTCKGIPEHVGHGQKRNDVANHVTCIVGNIVLDKWQNTTTNYHHHKDARSLSCIFAKALCSKVEYRCPHY